MHRLLPFVFGLLWLLYARGIWRGSFGPLIGAGDTDALAQMAFSFAKMLRGWPVPHLELFTDWNAYPYGIDAIFQAWSFELAYLSLLFDVRAGWLPLYLVVAVGVSGLGTYSLLRRSYSAKRSWITACLVAFFGFYSFHKYPHHFGFTAIHWMVLNLVADFLVYRRILAGDLPLRWVALRALLLLLLLGQDLSYCAGYGLSSFTLTALFSVFAIRRNQGALALLADWKRECKRRPLEYLVWAAACFFVAYAYVPLCAQVLLAAKSHPVGYAGSYWANPLRWVIPWFPLFHPGELGWHDRPEGLGAASPGWTLLLAAAAGGVWTRKHRAYYPLALLVLLCVLHHPQSFPVLKIFPWFSYLRVAGRSSVVYPVFLALLALEVRPFANRTLWKVSLAGWFAIALVELYTVYGLLVPKERFVADDAFWKYQATVRDTPGAAILDWPFCMASGNGVTGSLCPYVGTLGNDSALQRFTDKKRSASTWVGSRRNWRATICNRAGAFFSYPTMRGENRSGV